MNPLLALASNFLNVCAIIILPTTYSLLNGLFPSVFPTITLYAPLLQPCMLYSAPILFFYLIRRIIFGEEGHTLWMYNPCIFSYTLYLCANNNATLKTNTFLTTSCHCNGINIALSCNVQNQFLYITIYII